MLRFQVFSNSLSFKTQRWKELINLLFWNLYVDLWIKNPLDNNDSSRLKMVGEVLREEIKIIMNSKADQSKFIKPSQ